MQVQVNQEEPKLRTHAGRNYADLQQQLLSSRATAEVTFNIAWWTSDIQRNIIDHAFLAMINSDTEYRTEMRRRVPDCQDPLACAVRSL